MIKYELNFKKLQCDRPLLGLQIKKISRLRIIIRYQTVPLHINSSQIRLLMLSSFKLYAMVQSDSNKRRQMCFHNVQCNPG